jgi:hypothetical protein
MLDSDTQSSAVILMDESSHSVLWGGYRPGAGQKPKWNSGATATIRVPQALIEDVMHYAKLIDGQIPRGLKTEDCLSCNLDIVTQSSGLVDQLEAVTAERDRLVSERNELEEKVRDLYLQLKEKTQNLEIVTESSYSQALEILQAAISLKANAGGAIKVEIKRALKLLEA